MNLKSHASAAVTDLNNFANQLDECASNPDAVKGIAANLRTSADTLNGAIISDVSDVPKTFGSSAKEK